MAWGFDGSKIVVDQKTFRTSTKTVLVGQKSRSFALYVENIRVSIDQAAFVRNKKPVRGPQKKTDQRPMRVQMLYASLINKLYYPSVPESWSIKPLGS
jgi:hypothetical protein